MGMITAFNAVLECGFTGLCAAGFITLFARMGLLPILFISTEPPEEEENLV